MRNSNSRKEMNRSMRTSVIVALVLLAVPIALPAAPTSSELAAIERYKGASFDHSGCKKVQELDNGWIKYEWTEGRFLYEQPKRGYRAVQEPSGLIVYHYDSTSYSFNFSNGRVIEVDTSTGSMSWNMIPGDAAPDFELKKADGSGALRLSSLRGSVILMDFFASWCGPCKKYLPETQRFFKKYASAGLAVIGINIEGDPAKAKALVKELKLGFPVVMAEKGDNGYDWDSRQILDYGIDSIPRSILVDRKGIIRAIETVFEDTELLEKLIAEK